MGLELAFLYFEVGDAGLCANESVSAACGEARRRSFIHARRLAGESGSSSILKRASSQTSSSNLASTSIIILCLRSEPAGC